MECEWQGYVNWKEIFGKMMMMVWMLVVLVVVKRDDIIIVIIIHKQTTGSQKPKVSPSRWRGEAEEARWIKKE